MGIGFGQNLFITQVGSGSVAQRAGVIAGCRIVGIDGTPATWKIIRAAEAPCTLRFAKFRVCLVTTADFQIEFHSHQITPIHPPNGVSRLVYQLLPKD